MREAREYCRGLGDAVLKARKEQKITQEYIAGHLDINVRTLQKMQALLDTCTEEEILYLLQLFEPTIETLRNGSLNSEVSKK